MALNSKWSWAMIVRIWGDVVRSVIVKDQTLRYELSYCFLLLLVWRLQYLHPRMGTSSASSWWRLRLTSLAWISLAPWARSSSFCSSFLYFCPDLCTVLLLRKQHTSLYSFMCWVPVPTHGWIDERSRTCFHRFPITASFSFFFPLMILFNVFNGY